MTVKIEIKCPYCQGTGRASQGGHMMSCYSCKGKKVWLVPKDRVAEITDYIHQLGL